MFKEPKYWGTISLLPIHHIIWISVHLFQVSSIKHFHLESLWTSWSGFCPGWVTTSNTTMAGPCSPWTTGPGPRGTESTGLVEWSLVPTNHCDSCVSKAAAAWWKSCWAPWSHGSYWSWSASCTNGACTHDLDPGVKRGSVRWDFFPPWNLYKMGLPISYFRKGL